MENGWRVIAHPINFRIGRQCQPYRMDVIQQANFGTCYVVARAYSLEQQGGLTLGFAMYLDPSVLGRIACTQYIDAVDLLLQMSHVAWPVCLCVGDTDVLCKIAEPIEMPFGS